MTHCAFRIGQGFDAHRFKPGAPLILGGHLIPGAMGLEAHSDGDVLLHALMDALLGALALGDLGDHFPSGDPRYAGAASTSLCTLVLGWVRDAGWTISNVDLTVIAEIPTLAPHREGIRNALSALLALPLAQISVKATTVEGMGALGRREGMACLSTVLLTLLG